MLPGIFDTDRFRSNVTSTSQKRGISYDEALAQNVDSVPAKRLGTADEFGATCAFLCSDQAGYITGQNFLIDGGRFPGAF
jgi:3-oxoacyl-[acyl-carrier protein] reductase